MPDLREQLQETLGGGYRVEQELGGGGMSRVFVAHETALGRAVVVKVLHPDMAADVSIERFRREIRLVAQLQHPHIVPVLAAGETGGLPYFTMPYVEGRSLRAELASSGELPVRTAILLLREIASALAYSHARGIIHRDIKPENILISGGSAMVTDFGVAKALEASTLQTDGPLTSAGVALGTPAYMAPEQIAANEPIDARADIYAFGALAYELLTGSPPFSGRSTQALIAAHMTMQPEPIERRRPGIPPALASLVMCCLEKRPSDRPQSASEIADTLDKVLAGEKEVPTSRQSRTRAVRISALITGIAAILLVLAYTALNRGNAVPTTPTAGKSVAVMPFVNLSSASGDEYFSDGMTEELIDALSKLPGLKVAARSSVFALKRKNLTSRDVAKELGVTSVLEGTVRRSGDRLRISAQLIDAATGYSLWADRYDRDARDVFAIQDDISRAIVNNLRVQLGHPTALVEAPTENVEAHNLYLQGRFFLNKRTGPDISRAISLFSQAIALDSTYARAYAGLSSAYNLLSAYATVSAADIYPKALDAAHRALLLDRTLAEAHAALAITAYRFGWDQNLAERELQRSIALDPGYSLARTTYAQQLDLRGYPDSAVLQMRAALAAEPLSLIVNTMTGVAYYNARRFRDAEMAERKAIELDSTFVRTHRDLGWALVAQSKFADAEREFGIARRLGHDTPGPETAYLYAVSGRRAEGEALARTLETADSLGKLSHKPRYGFETALPLEMAMMQGILGNRDRAFYWLDRAYNERTLPIYIRTSPQYDSLRDDPRFGRFLARLDAASPL
jgi:eukaryotic-like serine/threonine-protein kinase